MLMDSNTKTIKIKFSPRFGEREKVDFVEILQKKYSIEICNKPDYYFCSAHDNAYLDYDCIRIYYTGECYTPNFNECDYAIGFDRLEFGDRYMRIPLYQLFQYKKFYNMLKDRPVFTVEDLQKKTDFCNYVVSNSFVKDVRTEIFLKLCEYKKVNSGGRYRNNIGGAVKDKFAFQLKHKFSIAFENCSYDGYSTEKLVEAFAANTIPIYWGDPHIGDDFNNDAFINCHQYANLDEVVERVKEIDNNDELYLKMMNEPILKTKDLKMDDFLYHIFDQPLEEASRRPHSIPAISKENAEKRHRFFEEKIYAKYSFVKNQIYRMCNHTMLGRARTK